MYTKSFIAEKKNSLTRGIFNALILKAHAEEAPTEGATQTAGSTQTPSTPPINFETLIAQARKEEKDKLYPRITKLEGENKVLAENINTYLLEIAKLKQDIESLKNDTKDSKKISDLEAQIKTLEAENETLKSSTPDEQSIRAKLEAEYEVKLYAQQKVSEEKDSISKAFIKEIVGSTKEEVDASVEAAKQKTLEIKKELGLVDEKGNPISKSPEVKPQKRAPVTSPTSSEAVNSYTPEQIRNMDPRSPEYLEFRKSLGLK